MPESRIVPIYQIYSEAAQRFDYFLTGGTATVLAFAIQSYTPGALPQIAFLAPVSWGLLLISLGAGLWHHSLSVVILRVTARKQHYLEGVRTLRELDADLEGTAVRDLDTGEALGPVQAREKIAENRRILDQAEAIVTRTQTKQRWAAKIRNVGLLSGISVLAAWKFLTAI